MDGEEEKEGHEDHDHLHKREGEGHTEMHLAFNLGEDKEKGKRMKKKLDNFMSEMAEEMLDEKTLASVEKLMVHKLKEVGVSTSLSYMRAYTIGFEIGIAAQQDGHSMPMLAGLKRVITTKEIEAAKKMPKGLA